MGDVLITRRGGLGGAVTNVLVVYVKEAGATVTVTKGAEAYSNLTDSAGYAYFTNLGEGTWTVFAVNSSNHPAPSTPTVAITATQTSYYVTFGFEFWLYDNSYADTSLNECTANSGGWTGVGGESRTVNYIATRGTGGGSIWAVNSFDLSNYNTVSVLANPSNGRTGNKVQVMASNKTTVLAEVSFAANTSQQWVTIDISAITAQAYIYIKASGNDVVALRKCYLA